MSNRRLTVAATFVGTLFLTFSLTYLLLQDERMAMAGGVGVVGLTVMFVEPFVGLVNYLLFIYLRPQDYVRALMGMPLMLMIGAATCFMVVLHMAVLQRTITLARSPNNLLVLWFGAAIVVSQLATLVPVGVMSAVTDFVPTLILYLLVANLVTSERRLKFVISLLVVLTMTLAVQGVVQIHTGQGLGGQDTYDGRIRAIGIFSDPNDLALALVMVQPFLLLKLLEPAKPAEKLLAMIGMAVLTYGLFLTQSRGGLIAFGLLMMIALSRRLGRAIGLSIGGFMMLIIVVLSPRMANISAEEGSTYGRIEAWTTGFDLFQQYPLFGVGFGNYTEHHFRTAHNSLVLCAAELGVFGLLAWVMLIYMSIKNLGFIARELKASGRRESALYVESVRYGFFSFMVAAYFLSRTYNELLFIFLGLTTAITHMFVRGSSERYVLMDRRDFVYGIAATIGAMLLTKFFLITAW
ncbi:MAG: O-antigen ligase family protein [Candidatus Krumholzibacteria bacterium]|nr:O-antigen ligase family protein [Candidatus Krumholzibacteria bacterium]MDH4336471.1 O-antigen ligase family protein [Candidatus Krumholzibacteria bacterium]MDH5269063.1 O-antigen ligase family protein [Candidatus Krumholzibacteria bacterium]